jgi:hypothetical protein
VITAEHHAITVAPGLAVRFDLAFKVYRVLDELLPTCEPVVRDFPSTEALLKMEFATRSTPTLGLCSLIQVPFIAVIRDHSFNVVEDARSLWI